MNGSDRLRDDRVRIALVPDRMFEDIVFTLWSATLDIDGSPYMDAVGRSPELALAALCQVMASEIADKLA